MTLRRLVLVGGGHAHLEVLRGAARRRFSADVVLVSPERFQRYSGMMPATLRGHDAPDASTIDLQQLCRAAGVRFVQAAVEGVTADASGGAVNGADVALEADAISLDVGATSGGWRSIPGAQQHAIPVRPAACWDALRSRVDVLLSAKAPASFAVCVVGGGAGGIELALSLHARAIVAGRIPEIAIVDARALLSSWRWGGARLRRLLEARGVVVHERAAVTGVDAAGVLLGNGNRVRADLCVWTTAAAAHSWLGRSNLPVDANGWLRVDSTLRAVDGRAVWGAGDCVTLESAPWVPKSGVYAVREAPILEHNLRVAVERQGAPRHYQPQRHALSLIDTADGQAIAYWAGITARGRWAWWLKRRLDRGFVDRYRRLGA